MTRPMALVGTTIGGSPRDMNGAMYTAPSVLATAAVDLSARHDVVDVSLASST